MNPERDDSKECWHYGQGPNDVNRNNEAEAKLYAASKNRKRNLAPKYPKGDHGGPPPPTPPPMPPQQHDMNMQQNLNPNIPDPSNPLPPPQPQPLYPTGTFPYNQRNPQSFHDSLPHAHAGSGPHRPQRLQVPSVLTIPTPQMGIPLQNMGAQPPPYFPSNAPGMQNAPGMPNNPPGMPMMHQGAIVHQPGMQRMNGVMGAPRLAQGMMMASYDNSWVVPSQAPLNCPPGLEYLAEVDQLLIHQQIEILELMTGFETKNKYMIRNILGQGVYFAAEESGCCNRQCLGPSRPFDLNFYDHYGNVVMHMYRPLACSSCCCPCCLQTIEVSAPPGNVIGTIKQNWNMLFPRFSVKNTNGSTLMKIHGPFFTMSCCCKDVDFGIMTANGKVEIGNITKQWSGFVQEAFTDTDNFSVTFPMDMDITAKALLLAAVFLIDFMYYESNDN